MGEVKKILVVDLAFIGDAVLKAPVLRAIKARYPTAELTLLVTPLTKPIAEMLPAVDRVMTYDKKGADKGFWRMLRLGLGLRKERFDIGFSLNFALRGSLLLFLAKIPIRVGYKAQHAELFLTHTQPSERSKIQHETLNHLEILQPLAILPQSTDLELVPPPVALASFEQKAQALSLLGTYFAICPLGSYERKNLPPAVVKAMIAKYPNSYLIGGNGEKARLGELAAACNLPPERVLAGAFDLQELAVFLQKARLVLTADTGPLHIAAAVGAKVVALFGPTDPAIWGAMGDCAYNFYQKADCSPCWNRTECSANYCMDFQAEAVLAKVEELLADGGGENG